MLYNTYGTTGVELSAIGFGGMRFASENSDEDCASLLTAAYDAGINYFDTAPGYGRSEDIFGLAFKEMKRTRDAKPFYVSTKTTKADPSEVRRDFETSLKRMHLDYIDFYHCWCVMSLDAYRQRKARGVLKEYERLKEEGLIRHICVSTHMTGTDIGEMLKDYPFEGVLLGYSAMNFAYRTKGVDTAAELKRGVVVMNPLGGGVIPEHPERFEFVKTNKQETVVQAALRFVLNDPRITVALVGFSTLDHIREAVSAAEGVVPMSYSDYERIREGLEESFNELCTGCRYCEECQEGIPVSKMMEAYNHFILSGDPAQMINRLRMHWGIQPEDDYFDKCVECGACEKACTQKLPIIERLAKIRDEVKVVLEKAKAT